MMHPTTLHEMARSVQQDMEREARKASLARAVARRGTRRSRRARAAVLASTLLTLTGALLLI